MTISKFDAMIDKMSIYRSLYNAPRTGPAVDYVWWVRECEQGLQNCLRRSQYEARSDFAFYEGVMWAGATERPLPTPRRRPTLAALQQWKERQMRRDETILTIGLLCACAFMTVALIWRLSVIP